MKRPALPFAAASLFALTAPVAAESGSLLDELLRSAPGLAAALTNVAQNLGQVDAGFALEIERNFAAMSAGLEGWSAGRISAAAATGVQATELQGDVLTRLGTVGLDVGAVATTAVGSLQSADLQGSFNASGLIERVVFNAETASLAVEHRGGIQGLVAMQNVSLNSGEVLAGASLHLADTQARVEGIATTAIGALQTGALNTAVDLNATVQGQMGAVSELATTVVAALVGQ